MTDQWHHIAIAHGRDGTVTVFLDGFSVSRAFLPYTNQWALSPVHEGTAIRLPITRIVRVSINDSQHQSCYDVSNKGQTDFTTEQGPVCKGPPLNEFSRFSGRFNWFVGFAYVLNVPLHPTEAYAVYAQGPNHASFGGTGKEQTRDTLSCNQHMIATALQRLLFHHRVASLNALRAVLNEPPLLDSPFDIPIGLSYMPDKITTISELSN